MSCFKGVLLWLFPAVALAGTLEAQKDKVEVYASADRKSSVVATLGKGDTLESGERSGMYWPVKTKNGKTGFVSVLMVKAKIEANSSLNDAMRDAVKKGAVQRRLMVDAQELRSWVCEVLMIRRTLEWQEVSDQILMQCTRWKISRFPKGASNFRANLLRGKLKIE